MKLTKRLQAILDIVPQAGVIADVGTDHGYLAVAMIKEKKAGRVIAIDVNARPLETAKRYIESCQLTPYIECRLSNGLQNTRVGELTGAVICGMGGFLMRDIIREAPELLDFYVVQPQNGQAELRQYMVEEGYCIIKEIIMYDMGKLYQAWLAIKKDLLDSISFDKDIYANLPKDSILWMVGALVAEERPLLWRQYIENFIHQYQSVLESMTIALRRTNKFIKTQQCIKELEELL